MSNNEEKKEKAATLTDEELDKVAGGMVNEVENPGKNMAGTTQSGKPNGQNMLPYLPFN